MKKRLLTLTAATLAATMVFGACGSGTGGSSEASSASQEKTQQAASTDTAEQEDTIKAADSASSSAASDGSTASSSGKTTITFWHSMGGVNGDALTHLVDQYNKENKDNVYVDAEYQGEYDDTINKLKGQGFDNIAERIYKYPEVDCTYLISGGYDLMVILEGKTLKEVSGFVTNKLSTLDTVMSTATHFILKKYKDHGTIMTRKYEDQREIVSP